MASEVPLASDAGVADGAEVGQRQHAGFDDGASVITSADDRARPASFLVIVWVQPRVVSLSTRV